MFGSCIANSVAEIDGVVAMLFFSPRPDLYSARRKRNEQGSVHSSILGKNAATNACGGLAGLSLLRQAFRRRFRGCAKA